MWYYPLIAIYLSITKIKNTEKLQTVFILVNFKILINVLLDKHLPGVLTIADQCLIPKPNVLVVYLQL